MLEQILRLLSVLLVLFQLWRQLLVDNVVEELCQYLLGHQDELVGFLGSFHSDQDECRQRIRCETVVKISRMVLRELGSDPYRYEYATLANFRRSRLLLEGERGSQEECDLLRPVDVEAFL